MAAEAAAELVRLAAGAEAGRRGEQRERGDDQRERGADDPGPDAYESDAPARKTKPTMFATRGGRESSSGTSPKRGCTSAKYATQGRQ